MKNKTQVKKLIPSILGIFFLVLAGIFWITGSTSSEKNFHDLIINNKMNEVGYINVVDSPIEFAYYKDNEESYYFVLDESYGYIVKMDKKIAETLKDASKSSPKKIKGVTNFIPKEIKNLGVAYYNATKKEEEKVSLEGFENWFGTICLEVNKNVPNKLRVILITSFIIIGVILTSIGSIYWIKKPQKKFKKNMNLNFCVYCGEELKPYEAFCPNCGKKK